MCTVTYIPLEDGFLLTSSRDEQTSRQTEPPKKYLINNEYLIFPKDINAGGSWIAVSEMKKARCLLNGAYENFDPDPKYIHSRGQILLRSFSLDSVYAFAERTDCKNTAPFTLLMLDYTEETECYKFVWDGKNKFLEKQNTEIPSIWSSATLYDSDAQKNRRNWFDNWLEINSSDTNIFDFHNARHGDDPSTDILMKRENGISTVSISSIKVESGITEFQYFDIAKQQNYVSRL
ncbi:MAG: NRDE family protein [Saprospiraceae bacterium]|nr:NRDE family protein [Saprospiraceae bacterium]